MAVLIVVIVAALALGFLTRRHVRNEPARRNRSRLTGGKNLGTHGRPAKPLLPATYCGHPGCGKVKGKCRMDEADATHATGMLGPRKQR